MSTSIVHHFRHTWRCQCRQCKPPTLGESLLGLGLLAGALWLSSRLDK